jgi:hypothetical protein
MSSSRTAALEAARDLLGLSRLQLWVDYLGLGGSLPPDTINAILDGHANPDDHNYDLLVQALNENFIDRAENHPLLYADELAP